MHAIDGVLWNLSGSGVLYFRLQNRQGNGFGAKLWRLLMWPMWFGRRNLWIYCGNRGFNLDLKNDRLYLPTIFSV